MNTGDTGSSLTEDGDDESIEDNSRQASSVFTRVNGMQDAHDVKVDLCNKFHLNSSNSIFSKPDAHDR